MLKTFHLGSADTDTLYSLRKDIESTSNNYVLISDNYLFLYRCSVTLSNVWYSKMPEK